MIFNIEGKKPITSVKFPHIPADQFTPPQPSRPLQANRRAGRRVDLRVAEKLGKFTNQHGEIHLEKKGWGRNQQTLGVLCLSGKNVGMIHYNTNMVENDPESFVTMAFWGSSAMFTGDLCHNMLQLGLFNLLGFPWPLTPKEVQWSCRCFSTFHYHALIGSTAA